MQSKFQITAERLGNLVTEKNEAYGNATIVVSECMKSLYPNGIKPEDYYNSLLIVRVLDKMCRISVGKDGSFSESSWSDIAGYGLLGAVEFEKNHGKDQ